jgi:membrane fusion protein (multidrug efflux system)
MNKTIAILICCVLALSSCGGGDKSKAGKQAGPTPVTLREAQLQPTVYFDEYPGTVTALSEVEMRAEVGGYITGIFFHEGEHVRKGQKLYEIDRRKYQAAVEQAQAALTQAKANQDRAQKDADRYIYLSQHDAIAKQILDHALTDLQTAKAGVANAAAAVNSARTDLAFATITAPFDGTIGLSQVKLGALVSPGTTLLNTISTENPMAVDFVVNEREIPRFTMISNAGTQTPHADSLFSIRLTDSMVYPQPGHLSVIDRAVGKQTGVITLRLNFPNADGLLKSGMSCTVRVRNQDAGNQILVPNKATIEQMGEYFVFVARDTVIADSAKRDKNDGDSRQGGRQLVALQRKVLLGRVIGPNVIVREGIAPGDRIVVDGVQKLKDGQPVTTSAPAAQPAGKAAAAGGTTH